MSCSCQQKKPGLGTAIVMILVFAGWVHILYTHKNWVKDTDMGIRNLQKRVKQLEEEKK